MPGRLKKKPEYNPELQFNNLLQELRDAHEEADSLRSLADELNISLLKLRKLLITADVFTSDICIEINNLYQSGKKIPEIMKLTGLSRASVHSYLPYTKGIYNAAEISLNAERCRTYKIRQEKVRLLKEIPSVPLFVRGCIYTVGFFFVEFISGALLRCFHMCPWDYSNTPLNYRGLIRPDYAPLWFGAGLFFEKILGKLS